MNHSTQKTEDNWILCQGIKSLLRCDEAEVVQGIARYVVTKYSSLRIGSDFVERNRENSIPLITTFLAAITRFLETPAIERLDGVVWVARLENERKVIEKLPEMIPELNWTELPLRRKPDKTAVQALQKKLFPLRRQIMRLTRTLLRQKYKFFQIIRVIEMIGYYARYLDVLQKGNYSLAIVSSHSNPHGIAFNLAARRCGIPVVLITHGMPVRPVVRLFYDLAIVHCEAAKQTYLEEGCRLNQTIIHGRKQDFVSMPKGNLPEKLSVGIFLCKDVNESLLNDLVGKLLEHQRVAKILIRPHPKNLFLEIGEWIESLNDSRVQKSLSNSVFDDLKMSDVVLGGNSSVLIESVTAGKPAGYVCALDYGSPDLHRLVEKGLIYPVEAEFKFDFETILRFYQKDEWLSVLELFANFDEDEQTVGEKIKSAVLELAKPSKSV